LHEHDPVLAGMINTSGLITIEVTKRFGESSIAKILDLVENATQKEGQNRTVLYHVCPNIIRRDCAPGDLHRRPPTIFMADQTFATWIYRALVMLVISWPCALVVSIP